MLPMKYRAVPMPQMLRASISMYMWLAWLARIGPIRARARPVMRSLRLPMRSLIIPAGSSRNILDRNHAETTIPTRVPV